MMMDADVGVAAGAFDGIGQLQRNGVFFLPPGCWLLCLDALALRGSLSQVGFPPVQIRIHCRDLCRKGNEAVRL